MRTPKDSLRYAAAEKSRGRCASGQPSFPAILSVRGQNYQIVLVPQGFIRYRPARSTDQHLGITLNAAIPNRLDRVYQPQPLLPNEQLFRLFEKNGAPNSDHSTHVVGQSLDNFNHGHLSFVVLRQRNG